MERFLTRSKLSTSETPLLWYSGSHVAGPKHSVQEEGTLIQTTVRKGRGTYPQKVAGEALTGGHIFQTHPF